MDLLCVLTAEGFCLLLHGLHNERYSLFCLNSIWMIHHRATKLLTGQEGGSGVFCTDQRIICASQAFNLSKRVCQIYSKQKSKST